MDMETTCSVLQDELGEVAVPRHYLPIEKFSLFGVILIRSPVEGSPGTMGAAPPSPLGTFAPRLMMTPD